MGSGGLSAAGAVIGAGLGYALAPVTGGASAVLGSMALGAALGGSVGGAGDSTIAHNRQTHRAEGIQKKQERAIEAEKKKALDQRKFQIDKQRMQLGGKGQGTRGVSTSGIKANIGEGQTLG